MNASTKQFEPDYANKNLTVTFSKQTRGTGLSNAFAYRQATTIKVNKNPVGEIRSLARHQKSAKWGVYLTHLKSELNKTHWDWVCVEINFSSEAKARLYVKENIRTIAKMYHLYVLNF